MGNKGTTNVKLGVDDRKLKKGLKDSQSQMKKFGSSVKKIAGIIAGMFAFRAIFQGIKKLITLNAEFGQSLANLSAITGAVGEDLKFYEQQAKLLGRTTTISAVETLKAFELMGSARPELLKNKEALAAVTKEAIILAEASGLELPVATKALANALNQFNAAASESGKFINAIAAGSKEGAGNIEYLSVAIEKSGTTLSMMNLSIEDNVALIETVAPFYAQAALAGNSLDKVFLKMKASGIGYSSGIFNLNDALEELKVKYESGESAASIFGIEHAKMGELLVANQEQLKTYTKAVTGTNIAYEQQAKTVDTIKAKWKLFVSGIEGAFLASGKFRESIKKTLTSLTARIPDVINGFIDVINTMIEWRNKSADTRLAHKLMFADIRIGLLKLKIAWEELTSRIAFLQGAMVLGSKMQFGKIGDLWEITQDEISANTKENKGKLLKVYQDLLKDVTKLDKKWAKLEHITGSGGAKATGGGGGAGVAKKTDRGLIVPAAMGESITDIFGLGAAAAMNIETDALVRMNPILERNIELHKELADAAAKAYEQSYLVQSVVHLATDAVSNLGDAFDGLFSDMEGGFKSVVTAMLQGVQSIINALLAEAVAALIAKEAHKGLLGLVTGAIGVGILIGLWKSKVPEFAAGGAAFEPTMAMVGEAPNISRSNPEYIGTAAQLGKMGVGGNHLTVDDIVISGTQLRILLKETDRQHANSF